MRHVVRKFWFWILTMLQQSEVQESRRETQANQEDLLANACTRGWTVSVLHHPMMQQQFEKMCLTGFIWTNHVAAFTIPQWTVHDDESKNFGVALYPEHYIKSARSKDIKRNLNQITVWILLRQCTCVSESCMIILAALITVHSTVIKG